jgi:UDP-N-acetylglucosamine acyltransferase
MTGQPFMHRETFIHPMAIVEAGAELGVGVWIGPFCHVGADARLGDNVELVSHVTVMGATTVGEGAKVYPQAVLGAPPQNLKHKGGRTTLVIGRNCTIREAVTMHVGTDTSHGETRVGENGNFLAYTHIAHDCQVGDNVTFANGATLAGHCEIGNNVIIGGLTALHQFVRVGDNAFLSGCSAVTGDVIPYGIVSGNHAKLRGLNIIGMKRAGMPRPDIYAMRKAYRMLFDRSYPLAENLERVKAEFANSPLVTKVVAFLDGHHKRHLTVPPLGASVDDGADDDA